MKDVDESIIGARDRIELANAFHLALERPFILEAITVDDFDGAIGIQQATSKPDIAVAALADATEELVVRNGRTPRRRRWRRAGG